MTSSTRFRAGTLVALALVLAAAGAVEANELFRTASDLMDASGLFIIGFLLILFELFLFPGHGAAAIPGILLIGWSYYICFDRMGLEKGMTVAAVQSAVGLLVTLGIVKIFPMTPAAEALFHSKHLAGKHASDADKLDESRWVGRRGTAASDLRPAGSARFDGSTVDVVCEDGFLESGLPVEVTRFDDGRILVRAVKES